MQLAPGECGDYRPGPASLDQSDRYRADRCCPCCGSSTGFRQQPGTCECRSVGTCRHCIDILNRTHGITFVYICLSFFAYVQIYNTDHILVWECFGLEFHGFSRGQRGYERWHARSYGYAQQWYSCWAMQTRNSMKCHEILGFGWYFAKCLGS